jgi:hypothetical protein
VEIICVALKIYLQWVNVFCLYILHFLRDWVKFGIRNTQMLLFNNCEFRKMGKGNYSYGPKGSFISFSTLYTIWIKFVSSNGQRNILSHCRCYVWGFSESRTLVRTYRISVRPFNMPSPMYVKFSVRHLLVLKVIGRYVLVQIGGGKQSFFSVRK